MFNNFISNLSGDGYNEAVYTANPVGIMLNGGQGGVTIAHNTVSLSGNTLYQTRSFSAGIYLASGSSATVQNNLISNLLGFAPGASTDNFGPLGALGLYAASGASQLTGISGNDYFVSPAGAGVKELGRLGNTGYTTVAAWQTASGEINAKNIQPVFVSAADLHLVPASNGSLDNTGSAGTITTDIDGDARSATTPDPGADEFTGPCVAPSITTQPLALAACTGSSASFTVAASGSSLTYQWRKGGTPINGATSASYTIASVTAGDAASYDVVITGACGNSTSNAVALTVNTPPAITTQPTAQTACTGSNVSFSVAATGTGLTYQWRKNGNNISGATSATLTLNNTTATDAATYDVVVSGTCAPSVTSSGAALQFFAAPAITAQPGAQSLCPGAQANFSVTATGQGLTYQWKKDGSDLTGATSANLDIANVSSANAGSYTVVVTNSCGQSVTSNAVSLTLLAVPVITVQPQNQLTICTGSTASFSVTATGSGLSYQWRKGGTNISGATNASYSIASVIAGDAGNYDVVISGSCGSPVTSNAASLSVNAPGLWRGTVSADWNDAQNWCGGVPTQTTDVVIPSGTAFSPTIGAGASVRNLTINPGATLSLTGNNTLSIYGDLLNDGSITAAATSTIAFRGAATQNARGLVTAGGVVVNGTGVVLTNAASVGTSIVFTAGNLTLGNSNLVLGESATGSVSSHIVVNGSGKVTMKAVGSSPKQVPVGPDAASVNPVTITNGQGRDYTVSVAAGISPAIADPTRAVNRTWTITPSSAPGANVTLDFQFETAHANTNANLSAVMEVGVHTGSVWAIASPAAGVTPQANGTTRTVSISTQLFGPMVISSPGGIAYPLSVPSVDPDLTEARLLPNLVHDIALLRLQLRRTMRIEVVITDAAGRVLHRQGASQPAGTSDLHLSTTSLAAGTYYLQVNSAKGMRVLRFVKE